MIVEKKHLPVDGTEVIVLYIEGLIKLGESAEFFVAIFQAVARYNPKIVVDLERVDYIDSTGLGELIGASAALAKRGRTVVFVISPPPRDHSWLTAAMTTERVDKLLRLAGAINDIQIFQDEKAAVDFVAAGASHLGSNQRASRDEKLDNTALEPRR